MNILPSSIPRNCTYVDRGVAGLWVQLYCANCGKKGGLVPECTADFAFYLCEPCADRWSPLVDTMLVPDEVFWREVKACQLEHYGRLLSNEELVEFLKDENNPLSKLAKDRYTSRYHKET